MLWSLVSGWSRVKMLRIMSRSIGRRLLARYSGSRFLRSVSVGLPSPVYTSASSARRAHALRMALGEQPDAQRAGGRAVEQQLLAAVVLQDVLRNRRHVVSAAGDVGVDRPRLVGAAVAFAVEAPGVVAEAREPVHDRRLGPTGDLQVEHRRRLHRRAVHEQNRAMALHRRARLARRLRHRNSLTLSAPARLIVQCSVPVTCANASEGCACPVSDASDAPASVVAAAARKPRRGGVILESSPA